MDLTDLIPIMGILLVMIPVAGLTMAFTLRFAVRPLVETLARTLGDTRGAVGDHELLGRIAALQDEVEGLTQEVRELRSAQDFDRKLLAGEGERRP